MNKFIFAAMALAGLAACDAVAVIDDTAPPVTAPPIEEPAPPPVPTAIAGTLVSVDYQPDADTARISFLVLDGSDVLQQLQRQPDFDVTGGGTVFGNRAVLGTVDYRAFTQQEGPNGRFVTMLVGRSPDNSLQATLASDGGRLGYFFAGADYRQLGDYTKPATGLATYRGTYAGLLNIKIQDSYVNVDTNLPQIAQAARPTRTVGDAVLYADFADNAVEGLIFNRVEEQGLYPLKDVILRNTRVDETGSFTGDAQQRDAADNPELQTIGAYGGVFGGTQAGSVAGGMNISDFEPDDPLLEENGIFILTCEAPNPVCGAP